MAARLVGRRLREVAFEVHKHRTGQVAGVVGGAARAPVEVPAHVAHDDLVEVRDQPVDRDEGGEHVPQSD